MRPAVVYLAFRIYDDSTGEEVETLQKAFVVASEGMAAFGEGDPFDGGREDVNRMIQDVESDFGTMDAGSSPDSTVWGMGYSSPEVPRNQVGFCVTAFRDFFVGVCGEQHVSAVVDISDLDVFPLTDGEIYQLVNKRMQLTTPL